MGAMTQKSQFNPTGKSTKAVDIVRYLMTQVDIFIISLCYWPLEGI